LKCAAAGRLRHYLSGERERKAKRESAGAERRHTIAEAEGLGSRALNLTSPGGAHYPETLCVPLGSISFLVYCDMGWTVETLNATVDAEVEALPEDMRARLARIAKLIDEKGLEHVGGPHVKHIEGGLWEMRLKGRGGIGRALYVTAAARRVVIVRVFVKKSEKTPRREIELALSRAKSVE